jgi:hypothetical protein
MMMKRIERKMEMICFNEDHPYSVRRVLCDGIKAWKKKKKKKKKKKTKKIK